MKIFVSHSIKDKKYLESLQNMVKGYDLELLVAENEFEPQSTITQKIKNLIDKANIGLVLLTKDGINSGFVREEIGYMEAKKLKTIMVFEKGIVKNYGGFKFGGDYLEIDPKNPNIGQEKIQKIILDEYDKINEKKKGNGGILIIIGLILAALFIGSGD